jgi:hypothetical protein
LQGEKVLMNDEGSCNENAELKTHLEPDPLANEALHASNAFIH